MSGDRPWPVGWGADGRLVLSELIGPQRDITAADGGGGAPQPLLDSRFNETRGDMSPDGRWIAYESDESGRPEVYVRPYPDVDAERTLVSVGGGRGPRWSNDGRLFYVGPDGMMETRVATSPRLSRTPPARLFGMSPFATLPPWANGYDVAPDGRLLMLREIVSAVDLEVPDRIRIVQNVFNELTRLISAR